MRGGPVAIYIPARCPYCGTIGKVTSTRRRGVRFHRCKNPTCGKPFKSVEMTVADFSDSIVRQIARKLDVPLDVVRASSKAA